MKKADIISAYNGLLPEVEAAVNTYKTVTGKEWNQYQLFYKMSQRNMTWSKDELERYLRDRQKAIKNIKFETEVYNNTEAMKSSTEGLAFIKSLEETKAKAEKEMDDVADSFHKKFNALLVSIGMEDWALNPNAKIIPSHSANYFSIFNNKDHWTSMHITIKNGDKMWRLEPGVSVQSSTHEVSDRDFQYIICKAYVTLCENDDTIHTWLKSTYEPMAHKVYDLWEIIDKADRDLKNPYEAWMENK